MWVPPAGEASLCTNNFFIVASLSPLSAFLCSALYFLSCFPQITRRYAEFSAALVSINQSHPEDQVCPIPIPQQLHSWFHPIPPLVPFQVDQCLSALQGEVENFILRMAAEFPHRKEQLVFLINNYDMLLSVLSVRTAREVGGVAIATAVPHPLLVGEDIRGVQGVGVFQESPSCQDTGVRGRSELPILFPPSPTFSLSQHPSFPPLSLSRHPSFPPLSLLPSSSGALPIFWWHNILCEGLRASAGERAEGQAEGGRGEDTAAREGVCWGLETLH